MITKDILLIVVELLYKGIITFTQRLWITVTIIINTIIIILFILLLLLSYSKCYFFPSASL